VLGAISDQMDAQIARQQASNAELKSRADALVDCNN
jgi:hypothetical protein